MTSDLAMPDSHVKSVIIVHFDVATLPHFRTERNRNHRPPSRVTERPVSSCAKRAVVLKRVPLVAESIRKTHSRKTTPRQASHHCMTL